MRPDLAQIDAFTDAPFAGNPAAVCLLDRPPPDEWMQQLAAEMNLSETAYLVPGDGDEDPPTWHLRWFTPVTEVDLCGHATLASAHHLFENRGVEAATLRFETRSGPLLATRRPEGWIELDLPADDPHEAAAPAGVLAALGVRPEAVIAVASGRQGLLVELSDAEAVEGLRPDHASLARTDVGCVIVTSVGAGLYDVVSRFFAPGVGIEEDPVTGAAHTTLAPYWAAKLGKDELLAHQVSARGGVLRVQLAGTRVHLAGRAVTVFRARLDDRALPPRVRRRR